MEELYIRFRDNTKKNLKERSLSIARLETLSGIKAGSLRNIIYGASRNPSFFTVYKIAKALDMPVDQLIGGTDELNSSMPFYQETTLITKIFAHLFKHMGPKTETQVIFEQAMKVYEYCLNFKDSKFDEDFCTYVVNNPTAKSTDREAS
ncbi:helix-turn-helix transcriptional regulator [Alphaproteobacteria bacterium]|nr:helix-turn-helix transcriptional regulator [Alphaproteobacteria bacterium]